MFTSEGRKYSDLNDFFGTSSQNALTGWKAITDRMNETDSVYKDWEFNVWKFTENHDETQFLVNEVKESIEIMRSSSVNYIIGEFNQSISASSEAVEKICNVILYIDFAKNGYPERHKSVEADWIEVITASGSMYYTKRWNKVINQGKEWAVYKHASLTETTIERVEKSGYSCSELKNLTDTPEKIVFASRRKAAAHGDFSRILIVEQFHGYVVNDVYDLVKLMNNKIASFDQYTKASNFIINVINEFNKKYSHS